MQGGTYRLNDLDIYIGNSEANEKKENRTDWSKKMRE